VYLRINTWQNASQEEREKKNKQEKKGEKGSELSDRIKIPQQICAYVKSLVVFFSVLVLHFSVFISSPPEQKKRGKKARRKKK
jgi:hypothetical protein